jgi:hypothetical protein
MKLGLFEMNVFVALVMIWFDLIWFIVLNATFSNISATSYIFSEEITKQESILLFLCIL